MISGGTLKLYLLGVTLNTLTLAKNTKPSLWGEPDIFLLKVDYLNWKNVIVG